MKNKQKKSRFTHLNYLVHKLGYTTYDDYLASDHWKNIKIQFDQSNLPKKCIACGFPKYVIHHIGYKCLGEETLGDIIPLCERCHKEVHKVLPSGKFSADQVHLILKGIFQWTKQEMWDKFECCKIYWEQRPVRPKEGKKAKKKKKDDGRFPVGYHKLSKEHKYVARYIKDGYSVEDVAKMYGVNKKDVIDYIAKYNLYF